MADSFPELIGKVVHHCGALEFLTNNAIRSLGKDSLLSSEIIKLPFSRRVEVLRELLKQRTKLTVSEVRSLCDDLSNIARERNAVAHNPIVSDNEDGEGSEHIMVIRHTPERAEIKKTITRAELVDLVARTNKALREVARLIPSSTVS